MTRGCRQCSAVLVRASDERVDHFERRSFCNKACWVAWRIARTAQLGKRSHHRKRPNYLDEEKFLEGTGTHRHGSAFKGIG